MSEQPLIKVIVNGAYGKMGSEAVVAIQQDPALALAASLGRKDDLKEALSTCQPDCVVDLTTPQSVYENTKLIIDFDACPVIGTTGLTPEQIQSLSHLCEEKSLGGLVAPNFSLGAVMMMHFARQAAEFFPDAQIIEMHHENKLDAPSGTALKTAELIANNRRQATMAIDCKESHSGALGAHYKDVPIHSVRLPGMVAHQMVIFGGYHETLTLKHDSFHRKSFMPGIIMACKEVPKLSRLVYGLENILFKD